MLAAALWSMGIAPVFLTFALWGMTTDVALAKEREVRYRYRNRYYTDSKTKLCGNKEDAIRLAKEMEA